MSIFIDVFLLIVIISSILSGTIKGFVKSVMNILTFAAAFICGWLFTPTLAAYYRDSILMQRITSVVENAINSITNGSIGMDSLFADRPEAFTVITDRYFTDFGSLESYYNSIKTESIGDITKRVSGYIASPIAEMLSNILAFLTIFIAIIIILKIVSSVLDLIFKLPVLSTVNRIGGFLFGAVCGVMYAWIFSIVFTALIPALTAVIPEYVNTSALNSSVLLNFFSEYNLWSMINFSL